MFPGISIELLQDYLIELFRRCSAVVCRSYSFLCTDTIEKHETNVVAVMSTFVAGVSGDRVISSRSGEPAVMVGA